MPSRDRTFLRDVLDAAGLIRQFVEGVDLGRFRADPMRHSAVIRQLEIMGEATKRLSPSIRDANPDIAWRSIAGMRDVLIHDYGGVDLAEVYKAATQSIPDLIPRVEGILEALDERDGV